MSKTKTVREEILADYSNTDQSLFLIALALVVIMSILIMNEFVIPELILLGLLYPILKIANSIIGKRNSAS